MGDDPPEEVDWANAPGSVTHRDKSRIKNAVLQTLFFIRFIPFSRLPTTRKESALTLSPIRTMGSLSAMALSPLFLLLLLVSLLIHTTKERKEKISKIRSK